VLSSACCIQNRTDQWIIGVFVRLWTQDYSFLGLDKFMIMFSLVHFHHIILILKKQHRSCPLTVPSEPSVAYQAHPKSPNTDPATLPTSETSGKTLLQNPLATVEG